MLANYLIGLREGLEASLIVVILIAYLVKSDRRQLLPRLWAGIAVAVAVSLGFGALLTFGPRRLTFEAQEAIGGSLSIVAVCFVTWMVFWMARHARGLSGELRGKVDQAADAGRASLAVVATLAVGREGLETALFLWAATQAATSADGSTTTPLLAALLGILTAVAMGYAFYKGVLKINLAKFFAWTGVILIVVAAGVLAYGVHDLQEAEHPARAQQPGLRRQRPDPAHILARDHPQGHHQLLARHDLARGDHLGRVRRADPDPLPRADPEQPSRRPRVGASRADRTLKPERQHPCASPSSFRSVRPQPSCCPPAVVSPSPTTPRPAPTARSA